MARLGIEELEPRTTPSVVPTLSVGPNVNVGHMDGSQSEPAIAINPRNPSQLFVATNDNATATGLYASFSRDGGATWHARTIADGTDGLPGGFTDPSVSWDTFGNLFFTYINNAATDVIVTLSTDGGMSFRAIASIPVMDQPKITAGVGSGMVWVVFNDTQLKAAGAPVTGLGLVGAFGAVETVPNSTNGNFGGISIGPAGQVVVCFQDAASGIGPDNIRVSEDPDGLGPLGFTNPTVASPTNVGGFRFIPAQPVRSVDAEAKLAFDNSHGPHRGRLYMVYTDAPSTTSDDLNIFLRFSDNSGATWSNPLRVNDDNSGKSQFFSYVAVDPTTGNVGLSWYDARNSSDNTEVETFATASLDGGRSVLRNVQVAAGLSSADAAGNNNGNDYGDYMGLDFFRGLMYPVWIDNSSTLPGNTDLPNFDVATARLQLVPAHPIVHLYFPLRYLFDPQTHEYIGNLTIQNLDTGPISGTFMLVFQGLPAGVTLDNATGRTATGIPTITLHGTLPPGGTFRVPIRLSNPGRVPLSTFFRGFPVELILPIIL